MSAQGSELGLGQSWAWDVQHRTLHTCDSSTAKHPSALDLRIMYAL